MAYLGRGWLAVVYFIAGLAISSGQILFFAKYAIPGAYGYIAALAWRVIGAFHGRLAARKLGQHTAFPWYSHWYSLLLIFAGLSLTLAVLVRSLVFQAFTIPASAMMPTVQSGDYLIVAKYPYGYGRYSFPYDMGPRTPIFARSPERGDVVILRFPPDPTIDYVKRVVGLPGDRVQMRSGILYLNGMAVPREPAGEFSYQGKAAPAFKETLNGRSYEVIEMTDSARGDDTSEFTVPDGHYFVLGDNRDNSLDSRFDVGFVPAENIYAKAVVVLFNSEDPARRMVWVK
ncbi:signal peptidase I [Rhizobium sp. BE258]|uniref:signal peptidase I n=1 Tax=Rhizobium sp. BE258 TaxID=2817722 RepID=UPI00285AC8A5|nr:signal peptidase I [Rhizobium sp. BE258]MDR7146856.1 signal peptidase I [Rhizobium sp. BE258]